MMMCSEASTGSNCLIPVPKRLPIPAAMIRNAVFIVFSLCYLLFHCFNRLSFNIYRAFLFVFPLYKILMGSDPKRRFRCDSNDNAFKNSTDKPFIFSNCSFISTPLFIRIFFLCYHGCIKLSSH